MIITRATRERIVTGQNGHPGAPFHLDEEYHDDGQDSQGAAYLEHQRAHRHDHAHEIHIIGQGVIHLCEQCRTESRIRLTGNAVGLGGVGSDRYL